MGPAAVSNWQSMAISTEAVGSKNVTVTLGATAVTANELAGGFFYVDVPGTAANGSIAYRIKSHPAAAASATCVLTLETQITIAIAAADTGSVIKSPWRDVLICATAPAGTIAGVALSNVAGSASSTFAWLQTGGPASVLTDGTLTPLGAGVAPSDNVAGSVEHWANDADTANEIEAFGPIGYTMGIEADTQYSLINLKID